MAPRAAAIDESDAFPRDLVARAGALGLMGVTIPEAWGGRGLDDVAYALAVEIVARASATVAVILAVNNSLVAEPLLVHGTDEQKARWLRPLARGSAIGAFALSEEHAGTDAANQQTRITHDGFGFRLNGQKVWVANAAAADVRDRLRAPRSRTSRAAASALPRPRRRQGHHAAGPQRLARRPRTRLHGPRLRTTSASTPISCSARPARASRWRALALEGGRVAIAAQALGVGQAALDEALAYAKSRQTFGQPIANYQAIQWMLADMATELDAARMLTLRAATRARHAVAHRLGGRDGQAVRLGGGAPRRRQGDADPRVRRLSPRLAGRAPLPRRPRHGDLPGHLRGPTDDHCCARPRSLDVFCSTELAARIDQAEARLMVAIAREAGARDASLRPFVVPLGRGVAIYAGPHSPSNKMIGVGFGEALDPVALDDLEARFAVLETPLQAEISVLADPEIHAELVARGYQPSGFEHVLGHPLGDAVGQVPAHVSVTPVSTADIPELGDILVDAFASPDVGGVGGDAIPPPDVIRRYFAITMSVDGFRGYVARVDGAIAGGGSLRIDGTVAQFCGAGTLPAFRRRGVQTALYRTRLADAAAAGCDVGVVVTQPGSKSQQNAQRAGFALLYARQLLIKPPSHAPETWAPRAHGPVRWTPCRRRSRSRYAWPSAKPTQSSRMNCCQSASSVVGLRARRRRTHAPSCQMTAARTN